MFALLLTLQLAADFTVQPTFNAGAKLTCGEDRVFLDTFFLGLDGYQRPSEADRAAMAAAQGDYAGRHLILVTHLHRDHADLALLRQHLTANPAATLAATAEIAGPLRKAFPQRITVLARKGEHRWRGVRVRLHPVVHANVENSAHWIEMCGHTVFHPGDGELVPAEFAGGPWQGQQVDVALVPFWYLTARGGAALMTAWNPGETWALHGDWDDLSWVGALRRSHPQVKIPAAFLERQRDTASK